MSDLPAGPVTLPELARLANVEPRVIWRAIQRGEVAAQRERVGMRYGTAHVAPAEAARVIRACAVARALDVPAAGMLRAAEIHQDGRTVTLLLPVPGREVIPA